MNGIGQVGQLAGTLYPGGAAGWLELAVVAVLLACGAVVLGGGIATARRARRRNGRQAPGPPPGCAPGLPGPAEPLSEDERAALDEIERHLVSDGRQRTAAPRRRLRRRTRARAVRR